MRRRAPAILLFLLLGAALNVVIAWACEHFFDVRMIDTTLIARERRADFTIAEENPSFTARPWIRDAYRANGTEIVRYSSNGLEAHERRCGWPLRSLWCSVEYRFDRPGSWQRSVHGGLLLSGNAFLCLDVPGAGTPRGMQATDRVLPLRSLWTGFILNSLFWAIVLWIAWMIPRWIRSLIWALRHRCSRCGYPVGVSPVCTECGRQLRRGLWKRVNADDAKMPA